MYIKGLVNTKDQSNACMCEMMSKGSKKALDLSNHTIQCYVYQSMSKGLKVKITFDPVDIHSIGWYGWKGLSLSFPKIFVD